MIDICLLGSGATMPLPERRLSSAIVRCRGRSILFDCGEGSQCALRKEHFSPVKIDLIALSHYHGDHIFGLPGLLQSMSCLERSSPLYIMGPRGLEEAMEPVLRLAGVQCYEIILLPGAGPVPLCRLNPQWPDGAVLEAFPTAHRVEAQGYRFRLSRPGKFDPERAKALGIPVSEWKRLIAAPDSFVEAGGQRVYGRELMGAQRRGLSVVFSGDSQPCQTTKKAAEGADLLIHDATYGRDEDEAQASLYGHSTFRQAAELAAAAGVRRLWLSHFSQMLKRPEDHLENAAAFPEALCGYDGLRLSLNFEDQAR